MNQATAIPVSQPTNTAPINQPINHAPSISSSSMLVELNISLWTGRKLDRDVSEEVATLKQATARAGNYHKKLFADEPLFEAITKHAGNVRTYHYKVTMPWLDSGPRLLVTPLFADYNNKMTNEQMIHYELVENMLNDFDPMKHRARIKLGRMFNEEDYPTKDELRGKFGFSLKYSPVPEAGDFRVDVGAEALSYLQEQYDAQYNQQLKDAYGDVWTRVHQALSNMSGKLGGEEKQIFRDSLVGNVREIVDLLGKFNITNDPKMREAERKIRFALMGVTAEGLREDKEFRLETKQKVDELLKEMTW